MGGKAEKREACHSGHCHVLRVVSEFNNKPPGSTNASMKAFLLSTSVYTYSRPFVLHVDSVIFFTSLRSEIF